MVKLDKLSNFKVTVKNFLPVHKSGAIPTGWPKVIRAVIV